MDTRKSGLFQNMSITTRLGIAGFLAIVCITVTAYAGYSGLLQSDDGLTRSITGTASILESADGDQMHDALRADVLNAIVNGPEAPDAVRQAILQDVSDHADRFNADLARLNSLQLAPEVKAELTKTEPLVATYIGAAHDAVKLALTDRAAAQNALPTFLAAFKVLEGQMDEQGKLILQHDKDVSDDAKARNAELLQVLLIAAGVAVAVLLVSGILLARSITKPIVRTRDAIKAVVVNSMGSDAPAIAAAAGQKDQVAEIASYMVLLNQRLQDALDMEAAIKRTQAETESVVNALSVGLSNLSSGNLTEALHDSFPPHYETLRANYNTSLARLNQTISQVVRAAGSIRGKSDEISRASEDLARRTETQAATLEQTAAALDELTTSVRSAAQSAREVETIVQAARREAEDSGKVVLGAVDAMNGIERSSDQISQIIGVIDDIAFQTNLLALNAGVEAARAGDAGRGFAVVASEVRALAQRSSDASKEIKTLISSSSQLVGRGVQAVGSAGKALTTMVDRVANISNLVSAIAVGAQEQSVGLGEVNVGVNQLDQVAQKNAAMVEQSMLATQSLREEAVGLDGLVTHFTTSDPTFAPQQRLRAVG